MARDQGEPAGAVIGRLLPLFSVALVVAIAVALVLSAVIPAATPFAPIVGILVAVVLLRDQKLRTKVSAVGRGAVDELTVAAHLSGLPTGWRVFHNVPLDRERLDHVIVSNRGVFAIEVDQGARVAVLGDSVVRNGRPMDDVVRRMQRQRFNLGRRLGTDVRSILVFVGADPGDHSVGGVLITAAPRLPEILALQRDRVLELDEGRRVFELLTQMTSRSRRRGSGAGVGPPTTRGPTG